MIGKGLEFTTMMIERKSVLENIMTLTNRIETILYFLPKESVMQICLNTSPQIIKHGQKV